MNRTRRTEKIQVLQATFAGKPGAIQQYRQDHRQLIMLTVQKEPNECYSVRHPAAPARLMTAPEYEQFIKTLQSKHHPVICLIRPERTSHK